MQTDFGDFDVTHTGTVRFVGNRSVQIQSSKVPIQFTDLA